MVASLALSRVTHAALRASRCESWIRAAGNHAAARWTLSVRCQTMQRQQPLIAYCLGQAKSAQSIQSVELS